MYISPKEAVEHTLDEFISNKSNGILTKKWDLIPKEQYKNLLTRYMDNPIAARIPDNIVSCWLEIIKGNVRTIKGIGLLWTRGKPIKYVIDIEQANAFFKTKMTHFQMQNKLKNLGFYNWARYPDGKFAYSDEGIDELESILSEETPDMAAEDKLILVNRCLNVVHPRNDLAMAFIEGGSETCTEISGQEHKN